MAKKEQEEKAPIVIRRVKKGGHGGHHGGSWKVAYADFVTAMMAFFMLLWLLSTPDKSKLKGLAEYFTVTPAAPTKPMGASGTTKSQSGAGNAQKSSTSPTASEQRNGSNTRLRLVTADIKAAIQTSPQLNNGAANVLFEPSPDGVRINLMDTATRTMFQGSTARLNSYALELLRIISSKIVGSQVRISVEGHTSSAGGAGFANWSLSSARAQSAMQAMNANGISIDRFTGIIAMAGTRPVYPDQPDRPENRRVTVVLLNEANSLPDDASFQF
jgi:chemotaxis protein MotB